METKTIARPTRTIGAAGKRLASAEPARAATKSPAEAGSIRTPVSSASRPCTTCRKSGTVKKIPIRIRFWASSIATPPRSARQAQQPQVDQRVLAALLAAALPGDEAGEHDARPRRSRTGSARSRTARSASCAARSQPQLLAWMTPKTTSPSPAAESIAADPVEPGACPPAPAPRSRRDAERGSRSRRRPRRRRRPASSARSSPSRRGSDRPRSRRRRRRRARRRRPPARWPWKLPATRATIAGRTSAAPIPSSTDQPSVRRGTFQEAAVSAEPAA